MGHCSRSVMSPTIVSKILHGPLPSISSNSTCSPSEAKISSRLSRSPANASLDLPYSIHSWHSSFFDFLIAFRFTPKPGVPIRVGNHHVFLGLLENWRLVDSFSQNSTKLFQNS